MEIEGKSVNSRELERRERTLTASNVLFSPHQFPKNIGGQTDANVKLEIELSKWMIGWIHGGDGAHSEKVSCRNRKSENY